MCTLWQRLGRAARDLALDAIAILFVESSRTDAKKEEKEVRREKREAAKMKRKADEQWVQGRATKRLAGPKETQSREVLEDQNVQTERSVGSDGDCRNEVAASLRERYLQSEQRKPKKKAGSEVEPAMDDFINAASRDGIQCYRMPVKCFFDFDRAGESISIENRRPHEFTYIQSPIT